MSKSEELRKRLEAVNRGPIPAQEDADESSVRKDLRRRIHKSRKAKRTDAEEGQVEQKPPAEPIVFPRDLPIPKAPPLPYISARGPHIELEEAVEGANLPAPGGSAVFFVERRIGGPDDTWAGLSETLAKALASKNSGLWVELQRIGAPDDLRPEDMVFFDLETTGLSSSPLFLIGTMIWDGAGLVTRQYFARDYSQEPAAVELFLGLTAGRRLLVSFNGKTFDQPFVRTRAAANSISCRFDMAHLDLLHVARRLWRHRLPDCKLQTLESCICGRMRHGDIPGHLIPDAYHDYVRTGNAAHMVAVLQHNLLDLITMADLIVRLPGSGAEAPTGP